jgi:hypothetical protein
MRFNEVKYQDPATKTYLGSPSIVRLDSGDLLATHDYFGPGCPRNHEDEEHLLSVYRSSDNGRTWANVTHVANAYWSSLFTLDGAVYLFGVSQQYGSIVIRRSDDGGNTWTHPKDAQSGLLFRGGPYHASPNYHCAPVPILFKDGRLYRAFEDNSPCHWPTGFRSCVVSARSDADLLDAYNWTMSNKVAFDPAWCPKEWGPVESAGWLEGNVVVDPDGQLWDILRFNAAAENNPGGERWDTACMVKIDDEGRRVSFDPKTGFIDLPGGHTKFTIRYDPATEHYFMLSNGNLDPANPINRSVLSLYASKDLRGWRHLQTVLQDDSGLSPEDAFQLLGFQYVDWQFDGDDLIVLVRTAYDGAPRFHDANRQTFHVIEGFRGLL